MLPTLWCAKLAESCKVVRSGPLRCCLKENLPEKIPDSSDTHTRSQGPGKDAEEKKFENVRVASHSANFGSRGNFHFRLDSLEICSRP